MSQEKKSDLPIFCRDCPQDKPSQPLQRNYYNEIVMATVNKILEKFAVNSDCKKNNCIKNDLLIDNPVDVYSVNSITNLDCVKLMVGNNEKLQYIQRSFFANFLNYVTDTLRIWNSNHSRSEFCTSSCIPFNLSKFKFKKIFHRTNLTFPF